MDVTPLVRSAAQVVQSYKGSVFKVSGQVYEGAVFVTPEETQLWDISGFEALAADSFIRFDVDVILLGTGAHMRFLEPTLRRALRESGAVVEVMDTAAACRTFNVLMAEGRRVLAALLPVGVL